MKYEAVFFDLDGTVADTLQNITDALNHTLRQFGRREYAPEAVKPHLGHGVDYLVRQLAPEIPEAEAVEILRAYRPYYAQHTTDNVRPYAGILPALEQLRQLGLKLALVSNKPDAAVQPLAAAFFGDLFHYAIGEQPGLARKPAPAMLYRAAEVLGVELSRCLYVGDSEVDLQTARNGGMDCLAVTWGFRTRQQLEQAGAATLTDSPAGIVAYVRAA